MQARQLKQTVAAAAAGAVAIPYQDLLAAVAASASTASAPLVLEELAAPRAVPAAALSAPHMVVAVLLAPLRALAPAGSYGERAAPSPSKRALHATLAREATAKRLFNANTKL